MTTATTEYVHVVCAACLTENRVPAGRLEDGPKCGKCAAPLLDGSPAVLAESSFDAFVGPSSLPVLVDYWAPWCAPCRAMAPAFAAAARELATRARFAKVNTEDAPGLAQRAGIRAIPTLVLYRDGREIARVSGAMDARSLTRWVERSI
jgi:thioredoxin 2